MKNIYIAIFCFTLFSGCKKSIEKLAEDAIVGAMTDGQWVITSFTKDGNNITSDFTPYKFQYYSNRTVDAIKNGTLEKTGTWEGNASTMSISANFTNANYPLPMLNGSWLITNNSWTFVEARQTNGTEIKTLRLEKQ